MATNSAVSGHIWPNFKLIRDFIYVFVRCKNEKDSIKNECHRVATTSLFEFSDALGQIIQLKSVVGSGRISNSFEILWLSLLPSRMKKIQSKMKAQQWPQDHNSIFQML